MNKNQSIKGKKKEKWNWKKPAEKQRTKKAKTIKQVTICWSNNSDIFYNFL
jgi:hypothetical protein